MCGGLNKKHSYIDSLRVKLILACQKAVDLCYGADLSAFCLKNKKQKIQGATWMSYSFSG
jgi:hypothetical protein